MEGTPPMELLSIPRTSPRKPPLPCISDWEFHFHDIFLGETTERHPSTIIDHRRPSDNAKSARYIPPRRRTLLTPPGIARRWARRHYRCRDIPPKNVCGALRNLDIDILLSPNLPEEMSSEFQVGKDML